MIELTPRQNEVFEAIKVHIEKAGFPPTMLELAGLIGCASPNAAAEHVKALKKKGYLSIAPGAARGITVVKTELDSDPVAIIKGLLSGGDMARDNAVEWLKKQGVTL
ncbi:LexA family transcriptional regulator [Enterobacter cloacae complex sp. IR5450]|uniref:LexA family protein n=1 Tax=Enterobacter cloacae complex sp. IR5450 TaxID=3412372 RepID=UPI003BA5701C